MYCPEPRSTHTASPILLLIRAPFLPTLLRAERAAQCGALQCLSQDSLHCLLLGDLELDVLQLAQQLCSVVFFGLVLRVVEIVRGGGGERWLGGSGGRDGGDEKLQLRRQQQCVCVCLCVVCVCVCVCVWCVPRTRVCTRCASHHPMKTKNCRAPARAHLQIEMSSCALHLVHRRHENHRHRDQDHPHGYRGCTHGRPRHRRHRRCRWQRVCAPRCALFRLAPTRVLQSVPPRRDQIHPPQTCLRPHV